MTVNNNYLLSANASATTSCDDKNDGSWFEAMATAWGQALDRQAGKIEEMSNKLGEDGQSTPSQITRLTAESLSMSFMSNSSHTALSSLGTSLETMARKQ
jgi:hypothetical protein